MKTSHLALALTILAAPLSALAVDALKMPDFTKGDTITRQSDCSTLMFTRPSAAE